MELDIASMPVGLRYNLLLGAVVPRPIAVVGTMNAAGQHNLAPFSFFNAVSSEPMVLMFCPVSRGDGGENDSLRNAKPVAEGGTGCFSVSIATEENIAKVVKCAADLAHGESEFDYAGLTARMCARIRAPYMAESPIHFECETLEVKRFAPGVPFGGNAVFGRVIHARVDDALAHPRMHIDPAKLRAVGRMGGQWYARTGDRFELERG
jgi:flavin reductase (DIM6/NTAB) family NADH-FMN oxidoreductase RutF